MKVVAKYSPSISFFASSWFVVVRVLVTSLESNLAAPFLNEDPYAFAAAILSG